VWKQRRFYKSSQPSSRHIDENDESCTNESNQRNGRAWKLVGPTELGKKSFFDIVEGNKYSVRCDRPSRRGAKSKEKRSVANVNSNIEEGYKEKIKH